ncbi:LacI family DNA-binding transcriptional regulator [Nocardioides sp. SLBN-35]|uniref:LacI family DNA-binding transcriptional regulator n=1 Tax=Nocardioides sp. SLBN-35 TaxID=2768445 RepID=UPI00135BD224|nr:LacI family DNA-binding transcriptional regulator [Nocardioides sp. SLBN-35]
MIERATLADVARAAAVSPTTASHALSGKGRVDARTRAHVQKIAQELNYVPSRAARSLALGRPDTIGLVLPRVAELSLDELLTTDAYGRLAVWASQHALVHGCALTILPDLKPPTELLAMGLKGLIVVDPVEGDPRCRMLDQTQVPYVLIGRDDQHPDAPSVSPDTSSAIRAMLDHLHEQGARRIVLLASDVNWSAGRDALEEFASWHATGSTAVAHTVEVGTCRTREEIGARARSVALEALRSDPRPDAVLGLFDGFAGAVVTAAREMGLTVPDDLLVAQDIDSGLARLGDPPITAIDIHQEEQVATAMELLMGDPDDHATPRSRVVPATLSVRRSTSRATAHTDG